MNVLERSAACGRIAHLAGAAHADHRDRQRLFPIIMDAARKAGATRCVDKTASSPDAVAALVKQLLPACGRPRGVRRRGGSAFHRRSSPRGVLARAELNDSWAARASVSHRA